MSIVWTEKAWDRKQRANARKANKLAYHRRRARDNGQPATMTVRQWKRCKKWAYRWRCVYCGTPDNDIEYGLTLDHWIPLSDVCSPGTVASNVVPACPDCNNAKGDQLPAQWLAESFSIDRALTILERVHKYFDRIEQEGI